MQICRIFDMGYKEVIELRSGARLGYVYDAEIDMDTGQVKALLVPGKARLFGLLGREEDRVFPWEAVRRFARTPFWWRHLPSAAWARGIEVARRGGDVVYYYFRV